VELKDTNQTRKSKTVIGTGVEAKYICDAFPTPYPNASSSAQMSSGQRNNSKSVNLF
jgi:hypothetical protein